MLTLEKYGLAVIRNSRLLLCRPRAYRDLIMPGGLREAGETPAAGLAREVTEEMGPDARLLEPTLRRLGVFEDDAAGPIDARVRIELYAGEVEGHLVPSAEIQELVWFDPVNDDLAELSAIVRNQIVPALQALGDLPRQ